jgi:peptidoglycan DL-endopeptidase CwlO
MAMHTRTQRVSPSAAGAKGRSPLRAAARPLAWSAMISSIVLSIAVGPAYATPDTTAPGDQVPNSGVRPVADRPLQLPGTAAATAVPGLSSLAQQITSAQAHLEQIGEQLKQLKLDHASLRTNLALADRDWRDASERLKAAQTKTDTDAAEAYKATVGLPPNITSDLRNLGALSPVTRDDIPGIGSARELVLAQQEERDKYQGYLAAIKAEETLSTRLLGLDAEFKKLQQDFLALRQRHANDLAKIELEREKRDQAIGAQYIDNRSLAGYAADAKALMAVNKALEQLGKPYVWGAEGPNSFDCSGLMWYSYYYGAGYSLPRVSRDQYNGTKSKTVSRYALLPGDLLFFATNPNDSTTVHHVGMYLGNGKMVHAPNTGDVVKISTVWWSEFFAATRVFAEQVAPVGGSTPPASSGGGSSPSPTPSPTPTPSQTTKPPSPTPTSPSPTPSSPSPTPSSPSPEPSSESPSPTPDPTSPSPAPANTESSPADSGSSTPATGSSESTASTEASSAAESPASTTASSSGS